MVFKVAIPGKIQFKMYRKEPGFFLTRQGDIHYIGGSEVLPPPLETEKENAVISDLGTEYEEEAKSILIEHLEFPYFYPHSSAFTGSAINNFQKIPKI